MRPRRRPTRLTARLLAALALLAVLAGSCSGGTDSSDSADASGGEDAGARGAADPGPHDEPPVAAGDGSSWELVFSDDFDGTELDRELWTPCFSWAEDERGCSYSFNNGRERYSPEQITLADGIATLRAEPVPGGDGMDPEKTYRSALLSTTNPIGGAGTEPSLFSYTYGYAEARLQVPTAQGFFTAWWLLPPDPEDFAYRYEIDVLEALGGDPTAHMTVHHAGRQDSYTVNHERDNGECADLDYSDGFHTYGLDWQPDEIAWYIDGVECGSFDGEIWSEPLELILNLMVDVDWQRNVGIGLEDPESSADLRVDYVKVWQRVDG
jgi:beta-glucanase (GH16 family)